MKDDEQIEEVGYRIKVDDLTFAALVSIYKTGSKLLNDIEEFLKPYNISHGRFSILLNLYEHLGRSLYPSDIADSLEISRPTVTGMLKKLVRDGLVTRVVDGDDARKSKIRLSKSGFALLEQIIPIYNKRVVMFGEGLNDEEKYKLIELLGKIRI